MSKKSDKSYIFSNRLCELYKNKFDENGKRITQAKLAEALDVSVDTVNAWCRGSLPSATSLIALADYFECDVDYLLGRIDYIEHENKFICEKTGLSERAVDDLKAHNDKNRNFACSDFIAFINFFLENDDFYEALIRMDSFEYRLAEINKLIPNVRNLLKQYAEPNKFDLRAHHAISGAITEIEFEYRIALTYFHEAIDCIKKSINQYNDTDFNKEIKLLYDGLWGLGKPIGSEILEYTDTCARNEEHEKVEELFNLSCSDLNELAEKIAERVMRK